MNFTNVATLILTRRKNPRSPEATFKMLNIEAQPRDLKQRLTRLDLPLTGDRVRTLVL